MQKVIIHLHAYVRHLTHPQVLLYLSINGEQFRIEKTKGDLPVVIQVDNVHQLLQDAKALCYHNPFYELTTIREKMPVTNDDILRMVTGLVMCGMMRVRENARTGTSA